MAHTALPDVSTPVIHGAPGRAAMLLVESLIHGLIARSVLSVAEAVDIVTTAAEVDADLAVEGGPPVGPSSADLLEALRASLSIDLTLDEAGPASSR